MNGVEGAIRRGIVFWLAIIASIFLAAGGCMSYGPSADQLRALAESGRSWCFSITTIYGTARMGGSGIQGGTVRCDQEGMWINDRGVSNLVPR